MAETSLAELSSRSQGLRMAVILTLPDSLLFERWAREDVRSDPHDLAAYMGDLIQANHRILSVADALDGDVWLTTETPTTIILVREISPSFALGAVFDHSITLGAARLAVTRLARRVLPELEAPLDLGI